MSANSKGGIFKMELNERKMKILKAIVKDYIETAEAVGSRTISKKYNLGVSAATIRNEMADLRVRLFSSTLYICRKSSYGKGIQIICKFLDEYYGT